jgi:transcriptional regulator with XRE-family HTH domain
MMTNEQPEKRERARELRQMGWSYKQIVDELGCAKSSVSNWCNDIQLSPQQHEDLKKRQIEGSRKGRGNSNIARINRESGLAQRRLYQETGREKAREGRLLHVVGCMLYWAEGAKSRRNTLQFANSDEVMMTLFVRFLREELAVADEKLKIQIHCYAQDEAEVTRIETYWLDMLHLPRTALYPTQVLVGSNKRRNRLTNGVCSVRVSSTELLMHILGAIQEYGNFTNEDWLY